MAASKLNVFVLFLPPTTVPATLHSSHTTFEVVVVVADSELAADLTQDLGNSLTHVQRSSLCLGGTVSELEPDVSEKARSRSIRYTTIPDNAGGNAPSLASHCKDEVWKDHLGEYFLSLSRGC